MFFESSEESRQIDEDDRSPDSRVTTALDALDIPYRYLPVSRTFEVHLHLEEGRSQCVYIDSQTHWFMGVELRRIFSAALTSDGPFESRTANLLLRENYELIHGGWTIMLESEGKKHIAFFGMTGFANLPAKNLLALIECVANKADEMENRLSGLDEF